MHKWVSSRAKEKGVVIKQVCGQQDTAAGGGEPLREARERRLCHGCGPSRRMKAENCSETSPQGTKWLRFNTWPSNPLPSRLINMRLTARKSQVSTVAAQASLQAGWSLSRSLSCTRMLPSRASPSAQFLSCPISCISSMFHLRWRVSLTASWTRSQHCIAQNYLQHMLETDP